MANSHQWKFALCSFENPPEEHLAKLAEKYIARPFFDGPTQRMSRQQAADALLWARDRFFFIRSKDDAITVGWILEKARAAVIQYGVKGLVIDPYNEIEHQRPPGLTETEYVSDMLNRIKHFARNHDLHVWFVAHPAKPMRTREGDYPVPSLYDISGSANWSNKADIGVVVERHFEENNRSVTIHVKKVRFKSIGIAGTARLEYDRATGIYSEPEIGFDS
jgi:twinkle protein